MSGLFLFWGRVLEDCCALKIAPRALGESNGINVSKESTYNTKKAKSSMKKLVLIQE